MSGLKCQEHVTDVLQTVDYLRHCCFLVPYVHLGRAHQHLVASIHFPIFLGNWYWSEVCNSSRLRGRVSAGQDVSILSCVLFAYILVEAPWSCNGK